MDTGSNSPGTERVRSEKEDKEERALKPVPIVGGWDTSPWGEAWKGLTTHSLPLSHLREEVASGNVSPPAPRSCPVYLPFPISETASGHETQISPVSWELSVGTVEMRHRGRGEGTESICDSSVPSGPQRDMPAPCATSRMTGWVGTDAAGASLQVDRERQVQWRSGRLVTVQRLCSAAWETGLGSPWFSSQVHQGIIVASYITSIRLHFCHL